MTLCSFRASFASFATKPFALKAMGAPTYSNGVIQSQLLEGDRDYYFDSYGNFGIHQEMLSDQVRTRAYMKAVFENADQFKGKIVLDIGAGTGILCMFAAKAGAKHVFGIEMASIQKQAKEIVKENNFSDVITILQGKVEEIQLPVPKVDIIISEWMGYFLLYESMLDTVLYARDKWLAPGGLILPDRATIHVAALEDHEYRRDKINFWNNVHGFDMSPIRELALIEPLVDFCDSKQVFSTSAMVMDIDIHKVNLQQLDFSNSFKLTIQRDDFLHGLVAWFDIDFLLHKKVSFSTGPFAKYTHWKNTVFYLDEPIPVCKDEIITGSISAKRNIKNPRDLDIIINLIGNGRYPFRIENRLYRLR